jgi:hypothetical protein
MSSQCSIHPPRRHSISRALQFLSLQTPCEANFTDKDPGCLRFVSLSNYAIVVLNASPRSSLRKSLQHTKGWRSAQTDTTTVAMPTARKEKTSLCWNNFSLFNARLRAQESWKSVAVRVDFCQRRTDDEDTTHSAKKILDLPTQFPRKNLCRPNTSSVASTDDYCCYNLYHRRLLGRCAPHNITQHNTTQHNTKRRRV